MIELNTHGASFIIAAHSPTDVEGWCKVHVQVKTNGFQGEAIAWLMTEGLKSFEKDLGAMMQNVGKELSTRLCSPEPDLDIQLVMNRLGQIQGKFALESERRDGIPTVLSGSFSMDQSFLPELRRQTKDLVKALKG